MKKENIINRLESEGYNIVGTKFDYWNVAGVELKSGGTFALADGYMKNGGYGCNENFRYEDVTRAIREAEQNKDYREDCKIYSMADYFHFKKPWNERIKIKGVYDYIRQEGFPDVKVGDEVELKDIWDGEGNVPQDSYSYKCEHFVETWVNYEFEILEESENPLNNMIRIIAVELI